MPREVGRTSRWYRTPTKQSDYLLRVLFSLSLRWSLSSIWHCHLFFWNSLSIWQIFSPLPLVNFLFLCRGFIICPFGDPGRFHHGCLLTLHILPCWLHPLPGPEELAICHWPDLCSPDFSLRLRPMCPQPCPFHFGVFAHATQNVPSLHLLSSSVWPIFLCKLSCYSNSRSQLDTAPIHCPLSAHLTPHWWSASLSFSPRKL